ncbi:hypothetical protein [Variibacter gotjawalensis]|uniref:hypothetical protein n=1 Tax=Variibacter gotjawalensis TaxID=1333996 RepID=UPI0012FD54FA|nr:hypothetical protein [Variibacter gotjawalensis]NIK49175.1 hypothetical protein [Variibacter gotjawalensis]
MAQQTEAKECIDLEAEAVRYERFAKEAKSDWERKSWGDLARRCRALADRLCREFE